MTMWHLILTIVLFICVLVLLYLWRKAVKEVEASEEGVYELEDTYNQMLYSASEETKSLLDFIAQHRVEIDDLRKVNDRLLQERDVLLLVEETHKSCLPSISELRVSAQKMSPEDRDILRAEDHEHDEELPDLAKIIDIHARSDG